jgi:ribosomal protein S18 acetylase RimI-like enzyme
MAIRQLKKSDAGEYRRLRLEALQKAPWAFGSSSDEEKKLPLSAFAHRLAAKDSWVFGAFSKGKLVGILGLNREPRLKRSHQASLVGMYVSTAFQKQGIGAALMDEAIAHARKLGTLRYLKLNVAAENEAARSLYASRGFVIFGVEREALFVGDRYLDEDYMVLRIHPGHRAPAPTRGLYRQSVQ